MVKIYGPPRELPAPQADYEHFDFKAWQKTEDEYLGKLKKYCEEKGSGDCKGEMISFGVADGRALLPGLLDKLDLRGRAHGHGAACQAGGRAEEGDSMRELMEETARKLERLSLELKAWNDTLHSGGWSTIQEAFNEQESGRCAVLALRIREELARPPKPE